IISTPDLTYSRRRGCTGTRSLTESSLILASTCAPSPTPTRMPDVVLVSVPRDRGRQCLLASRGVSCSATGADGQPEAPCSPLLPCAVGNYRCGEDRDASGVSCTDRYDDASQASHYVAFKGQGRGSSNLREPLSWRQIPPST